MVNLVADEVHGEIGDPGDEGEGGGQAGRLIEMASGDRSSRACHALLNVEHVSLCGCTCVLISVRIVYRPIQANKVETNHAQMKSYGEVSLRVRFVRGFSEKALTVLLMEVVSEWGKRGLASKPFPLSRAVLLCTDILTSAGFTSARDKDRHRIQSLT